MSNFLYQYFKSDESKKIILKNQVKKPESLVDLYTLTISMNIFF